MKTFIKILLGISFFVSITLTYVFSDLESIYRIGFLYGGIIFGIYFFHMLGEKKGHLFDYSKLIVMFSLCLIFSVILAFLINAFENIRFLEGFIISSTAVYAFGYLYLALNLKK